MITSAQQARTLADYRPQHDDDCRKGCCHWCGLRGCPSTHDSGTWGHFDCDCGLDTLLATLREQGEPEDLLRRRREVGHMTQTEGTMAEMAAIDRQLSGETPTVEEANDRLLVAIYAYAKQPKSDTANKELTAAIAAVRSAPPLAETVK